MSAKIYIVGDEPQSKEYDSLPLPTTTGDAASSSASSGMRILYLLRFINPLFYARLVQAYILTVLESYSAASRRGNTPRITGGDGNTSQGQSEVARCTTVDKCFMADSPECGYSHRLGLDGTYHLGSSIAQGLAPLSDVNLHHPETKDNNSEPVAEHAVALDASAPSPNVTTVPAVTSATDQSDKTDDVAETKQTRKAKRGKSKGKGKGKAT
ncbi:hypothetical protein IWW38_003826 [Coemansia aciculifera]|uniref:Uncharacterized protein n=1 Tax=Coemansia aciculifera TaxID=417176 RepID=A0ACC1M1B4_9FUNG|nr:hypothetical protein IWW38_003826 [Coemansia aciculifera]